MSSTRLNVRLEWRHPVIGRVSEVACPFHCREMQWSLRMLGIGVSGCESPGEPCLRCEQSGEEPRVFLRRIFGAADAS